MNRSLVLVGLMGVGKSAVGRGLAHRLKLPFVDADAEIEKAANRSVNDIFSEFGEAAFRDGERRVIARLLEQSPQVLATGGGAFMNAETRELIAARGISVWLRADLETLFERVSRRDTRPLLKNKDPKAVLQQLMATRDPFYAQADLQVESRNVPVARTVDRVIEVLQEARQTGMLPGGDKAVVSPAMNNGAMNNSAMNDG